MKNLSRINNPYNDDKDFSGCSIFGMMNVEGKRFSSRDPVKAIANMHERGNGLGGGFAAYGIYPEHADDYAFHVMYLRRDAKEKTEKLLKENFEVTAEEEIPTREANVHDPPLVWRYFVQPSKQKPANQTADDYVTAQVMRINTETERAFVFSSGKNMGVFKGVLRGVVVEGLSSPLDFLRGCGGELGAVIFLFQTRGSPSSSGSNPRSTTTPFPRAADEGGASEVPAEGHPCADLLEIPSTVVTTVGTNQRSNDRRTLNRGRHR